MFMQITVVRFSLRCVCIAAIASAVAGVQPAQGQLYTQAVIVAPSGGGRTFVAPGAKFSVPLVIDMSVAGSLDLTSLRSYYSWSPSVLTLDSVSTGTWTSISPNLGGVASGRADLDGAGSTITSNTTIASLWFTAIGASGTGTRLSVDSASGYDTGDNQIAHSILVKNLDVCVGAAGKWGDANNDLSINILDAQQIARFAVGLSVANATAVGNFADVNRDNSINIIDAQQVARFSVGLSASVWINTSAAAAPATSSIAVNAVRIAYAGAIAPSVTAGTASLGPGDQVQIEPTVTGANGPITACANVTYTSSNPSVATVNTTGLVDAISAGTTTITVRSGTQTATQNLVVINYGTITAKAGTALSIDPAGTLHPSTQPIFVARDGAGVLAPNVPIELYTSGRCQFDLGGGNLASGYTPLTDAVGEVKPTLVLSTGSGGSGCIVEAYTYDTRFHYYNYAVSTAITYPVGTTHVWVGSADPNWANGANWVRPGTTPAAPSSANDVVFIPGTYYYYYYGYHRATLLTNVTVQKLAVDTSAELDLNGKRVDVGSGGVVGDGYLFNGTVRLTASSAPMASYIDQVEIGAPGACGGASPMTVTLLGGFYVGGLKIYCKTDVPASNFIYVDSIRVFANGGQGLLSMGTRSYLDVYTDATFAGDGFTFDGDLYVGGNAVFGGQSVTFGTNGTVSVYGDATFNAVTGSYSSGYIDGYNFIVGGPGAGPQRFIGGNLYIQGNFTQLAGTVPGTFITSNDNIAYFQGNSPQTITLADPTSAVFSQLYVSSAALTLASNVNVALTQGSTTSGVYVANTLIIPATRTLAVQGSVLLTGGNSVLTVNGALTTTGTCSGRVNGGIVNGTGTVNGQPTASACP